MATPPATPAAPDAVAVRDLLTTPIRAHGTAFTIVKAALAAALAFGLATLLGPARFAFLAPVVALFTVQGSVLGTLGQGVQRVLGNMVGVALASVWVHFVGVSAWSLGLALLGAMFGARALPLGYVGQSQITLSVLLTVVLGGGSPAYGLWRVLDALIGGLVGIAIGVLLPERPAFGPARAAQDTWALTLAVQLEAVAAELEQPPTTLAKNQFHTFLQSSRDLHRSAADGRTATVLAGEGVLFNPRARRERHELARLQRQERHLVRLTLEVRVLSLTIDQLYDRPDLEPRLFRGTAANLLRDTATLVRERRAGRSVADKSIALRGRIASSVTAITTDASDAYGVLDSVSLLGRIEQLRQEIVAEPSMAHDVELEVPGDLTDTDALGG